MIIYSYHADTKLAEFKAYHDLDIRSIKIETGKDAQYISNLIHSAYERGLKQGVKSCSDLIQNELEKL